MFKKATIISFSFLAIFMILSIALIVKGENEAFTPTHETNQERTKKGYPTKQMRTHVTKDIWYTQEGERLHHYIETPRSILTAYPNEDGIELVEQMQGMKCYCQEKIEENEGEVIQQIRLIESEEGIYYYSNHHFDANRVFIALFRMPGKELQTTLNHENAFLKGVAERVSLSFDHTTDFQAEKFKAQIRSPGRSL